MTFAAAAPLDAPDPSGEDAARRTAAEAPAAALDDRPRPRSDEEAETTA